MERGFLSQKGSGGGRGVKEKLHGSAHHAAMDSEGSKPGGISDDKSTDGVTRGSNGSVGNSVGGSGVALNTSGKSGTNSINQ
ncbi:hypothetical protein CTI12_AA597460 [Artemisia annua]|uniref:Uncharacterized protein n=1 Tax=Artemisia annua TaxID=35608 RepID=A0A2U1KIV3_ARTAN|nr:hypothetical protein CTI12_AA597460 [Artemisia annua]